MIRFIPNTALVSLISFGTCLYAQNLPNRSRPDFELACHSATTADTSMKETGAVVKTNLLTHSLRISRFGKHLNLQIDINRTKALGVYGKGLDAPDVYNIIAQTGEGLVAMRGNALGSIRVLTLNRALTFGILNESGFSFLEPISQPTNYTVSFTCQPEKF